MNTIHPSAVIDPGSKIGESNEFGPGCVISAGVEIGDGNIFGPNVVVGKDVKIGDGNRFHSNSVVGEMPQILGMGKDAKFGRLEIGDRNVVRENATIHPSMHEGGKTTVGCDNLLMIGVHIGHDCVIGDMCVMSNYVQISGHCHINSGAWLSGMVLIHQFVTVGGWCYAAGLTGINHDVPPFMIVSGHYPPRVRGVNKRGLGRAGLDEGQQVKVMKAYKRLYRTDGALLEKAKVLFKEDGVDENVRLICESIIHSSEQRFGRYLELFR